QQEMQRTQQKKSRQMFGMQPKQTGCASRKHHKQERRQPRAFGENVMLINDVIEQKCLAKGKDQSKRDAGQWVLPKKKVKSRIKRQINQLGGRRRVKKPR